MNFEIVCTGLASKAMINKKSDVNSNCPTFDCFNQRKNPQERLHVALISGSGSIIDVHINGMKIMKLNWTFKVPDSKSYFGFSAKRKIYLIYGHEKQITLMKSNKFHRTIPNSKLPIADASNFDASNFDDWSKSNRMNNFDNKLSIYGVHAAFGEFVWILGKTTNSYSMYLASTSGIES